MSDYTIKQRQLVLNYREYLKQYEKRRSVSVFETLCKVFWNWITK